MIFTVVRSMPTPHCGDLLRLRVALNPSQVIQRSNLIAANFFLYQVFPLWGISSSWSLSHLTQLIKIKFGVRRGVEMHIRAQLQQHHTHKQRRERTNQNDRVSSKMRSNLSLTNQKHGRRVSELYYALVMLGYLLHAPRGPFYSPKEPKSHWFFIWEAISLPCLRVHRTVRCTPDTE